MTWNDEWTVEDDGAVDERRRLWPWIVAGVGAVLVVVYVLAAFWFAGRIPPNTTVAGVDIGGMSESDAAATIESELDDVIRQPVPVTVVGTDISGVVDAAGTGVEIDGSATVDGITGLSFSPVNMWRHLSGSAELTPVLTFDDGALASAIDDLNEQLGTEPTDAGISFAGSTIQTEPQMNGTGIDVDSAVAVLSDGWLSQSRPIELEAVDLEPEVTDEDVERVRAEQAEPLVAAPLTVTVGEREVVLEPVDLAAAASFETVDGELTMKLDRDDLVDRVSDGAGDDLNAPKDAQIIIEDHAVGPVIKPSEKGMVIDREATGQAIVDVATTETRTVAAVVSEEEPEFTTADAEALGINEVVSEISTPLTNDSVRTENLILGTSRTNNVLIRPGETFSLLEHISPITAENGYVSSGVVMDGFNSTALGGGLSQLSTNTFNIGYRAGMEDVAHQPHSKYFDRYPMGVEATVWVPDVDMKWRNTSPYGALVETWVEGGQVRSRLWSTQYFDVNITVSEPYNFRQPRTEVNTSPTCEPYPAGGPGFTVDVRRTVKREGEMIFDNSYSWTYQPVHAAVCG
ncbi:VanW family protein [Flaviflexus huanghaiensis]|uniref:VanW family protein n=1 Tax=Flaviflexus huanghaiensis TaxID=1111473 RepID=UPI0015FB0F76|nr:VanW family protein [Flaviflexus huanghaiensis]